VGDVPGVAMRGVRWAGPGLLLLGAILIAAALATGGAQFELIVIVPVFVGGASALFLGGVAALLVGFFLLPLTFGATFALEPTGPEAADGSPAPRSGGVILIGPLPLFFGAWKSPSRVSWWIAAGVGAAMVVAVLVIAASLR
jgi:uncharacterized membrane protein